MMRWIVEGEFIVESPLSLRTGSTEDDWPASVSPNEVNDLVQYSPDKPLPNPPVLGIELDVNGQPVLPASAIKGLLRGLVSRCRQAAMADSVSRLFGELPKPTTRTAAEESGQGGAIEFRAARLRRPDPQPVRPAARGKTEIAEGTRTADDGQLRHDRIVAPGTRFKAEFVLTRATREDVATLLGLLSLVDGSSSDSAIGSSTSQGDGRIRWKPGVVKVFGKEQAKEWLGKSPTFRWQDFSKSVIVDPIKIDLDQGVVLNIPLQVAIGGHFLVGAWGRYTDEEGEKKQQRPIRRPLRLTSDDLTTARLPGSSLDGALRAQARRIYRTISGDALPWDRDDTHLPPSFASLFGSSEQTSLLEVETFTAEGLKPDRQEFVAIDRFSGGVSGDKKFAVEAFERPKLTGRLRLRLLRRVNPALTGKQGVSSDLAILPGAVGLLALVLKDLACGDIPLGHATRKGYGGVEKLTSDGADWKGVLRAIGAGVVVNSDVVPGYAPFKGMMAEDALRHCVDLLQAEAAAWAASRVSGSVGETA